MTSSVVTCFAHPSYRPSAGHHPCDRAGRGERADPQLLAATRSVGVEQASLELAHQRASQINGCSWCVSYGVRNMRPSPLGRLVGLAPGHGIEAAVRGAEVIVHCAGSRKGDEQKTRTLVSAAKDTRHIVLISVVGADRIPQTSAIDRAFFGYYSMKLATERVVGQSDIGWTTLRATQFHDLILIVARALAKLPVIPAPAGFRFQPVDAVEVAERMAELALGEPSGLVPDLAGPKIYTVAELVNSYLSAAGKRRPLVPVHIPTPQG